MDSTRFGKEPLRINIVLILKMPKTHIIRNKPPRKDKSFSINSVKSLFFLTPLFFTSLFSQSFIPTHKGEIIKHKYFTLSYIEKHEQSEWVHYLLTKEMINGAAKRKDNFRKDPNVSTGSASPSDYAASGYDKGHLASAADMSLNAMSMSESFYMTNMSPQEPSFNRGGWKKIEELVRAWASKTNIFVTVGGVLKKDLKKIGQGVSVPENFYKIVFNPANNSVIAFYTPNTKLASPLTKYVVSVDQIEKETGIDFLSELKDDTETQIESTINVSNWDFNAKHTKQKASIYENQAEKLRCSQILKSSGKQCSRNAKESSPFCWQHSK